MVNKKKKKTIADIKNSFIHVSCNNSIITSLIAIKISTGIL